jgi:GT2 family glycosyltransferase
VIPIYNQYENIQNLIDAIKHQKNININEVEVMLVDNNSSGIEIPDASGLNFNFLTCTKVGSYAARNIGIRNSLGDLLIFTDADCIPDENWISSLLKSYEQGCIVAGAVNISFESKNPGLAEVYDVALGIPQRQYVKRGYAATANILIPKEAINKCGSFNEDLLSGGDAELTYRLRLNGWHLVYEPSAIVNHPPRKSLKDLFNKKRRIVGGQFAKSKGINRAKLLAKLLMLPGRDIIRIERNELLYLKDYIKLTLVIPLVWLVSLYEYMRLLTGSSAQR